MRYVTAVVVGAAAWFALVVLPVRGTEEMPNGLPYVVVLLVGAAVLGLVLGGHPLVTGALLVAPALLAAPWTAPRGDNDGLWLLIFPGLVWYGLLAAGAHWLAVRVWGSRHERYRTRTWLRTNLPHVLSDRIAKGPQDCGRHEWYSETEGVWRCYHCAPGVWRGEQTAR
jgi:hypothetical protein